MGGGAEDRLVKGSLREEKRGEEDVAGHCGRMDWEGDLSEGEAAMASCSKPIKSIFQLGSVNWNFGVKAGARGGGGFGACVPFAALDYGEEPKGAPCVYVGRVFICTPGSSCRLDGRL